MVRCEALATAASDGVCRGCVGGVALFLDAGGEEQLCRGFCLCLDLVCFAGVAIFPIIFVGLLLAGVWFYALM